MGGVTAKTNLAPEIRRKLAALRWRIRGYVWLQGLSLAAVWLILTFWAGLALDYLPVRLGAGEMPRAARGGLLIAVAVVLAYIFYRWIGRRTFVRLDDRSMALLLERHFSVLGESLITAVEMIGRRDVATPASRQMLATTQLRALRSVHPVRVSRVLNPRPLVIPLVWATALFATLGVFYVVNSSALELGVQRIYLLDERLWPRRARIEIVGVEATGLAVGEDQTEGTVVPFVDNQVKVARGSDVSLLVRGDAAAEIVPERCAIAYRTSDGDHGRVWMTRVGQIRDGFQHYRFDGKPLSGIVSDVRLDVVGFDHRIPDQVIRVVDRPLVVRAEMDCVFPDYLVDESTSSWLPRTIPLSTGARLPRGTAVTLRASSNKELRAARITNPETGAGESTVPGPARFDFECSLGVLDRDLQLEIRLIDAESVTSEDPYRVFIEAVDDLAPVLNVRLDGIGDAVTPDVAVALEGTVTDDYGVDRGWIDVLVNDGEAIQLPFAPAGDRLQAQLDFRKYRREGSNLLLAPGDNLQLTAKAQDRYDLDDTAHVGVGDAYQIEVVTPEQLLAMLETRELGLRQRFEQIIQEMKELRDSLLRVKSEGPRAEAGQVVGPPDGDQQADQPTSKPGDSDVPKRIWSLRLLRGQRSLLQARKSAQETLGVAAAFRDIQLQLVNNRVDSEDRRQRLEEKVAAPLEHVGQAQFPELEERLVTMVAAMDEIERRGGSNREDAATVAAAEGAIEKSNTILLAMDAVLQNMLELEGYNDLLDMVRSLIADQESLIDRTRQEQKRQILGLPQ